MRADIVILGVLMVGAIGSSGATAVAEEASDRHPTHVVLVRGPFPLAAGGLDELAQKLRGDACDCRVMSTTVALAELLSGGWAENARRQQASVVLIGHSVGADLASRLARELATSHLSIDLLVLIDAPHPATIPANVRRCVNIFQPTGVTGRTLGGIRGAPSVAAEPSRTEMVNLNVRDLEESRGVTRVRHYNIATNPFVHRLVRREVRELKSRDSHEPLRLTRLPAAPPE